MNATFAADEAREPAAGLVRRGGGTILDAIGNTPLIMVDGIWVKLEYLNPSGSIKARIAKYMIERAEREGLLRPGDTIVEASSGNTGNAMSMVAAVKGYRMLVVMPDTPHPISGSIHKTGPSTSRGTPLRTTAGQGGGQPAWASSAYFRMSHPDSAGASSTSPPRH
jgi:hypothetical protein